MSVFGVAYDTRPCRRMRKAPGYPPEGDILHRPTVALTCARTLGVLNYSGYFPRAENARQKEEFSSWEDSWPYHVCLDQAGYVIDRRGFDGYDRDLAVAVARRKSMCL